MRMVSTSTRPPQEETWCIVFVPGWSESGFEIAEYKEGFWHTQNGVIITAYVESWVSTDNIKTPY